MENKEDSIKLDKIMEFGQRLDYYWQYNLIYFVILLVYTSIRGLMSDNFVIFITHDSLIMLFVIIISFSLLNLILKKYRNTSVILGEDFIIFKNRFRQKEYKLEDIEEIRFYKEKIFKTREVLGLFKIKIKNKKRIIRLRATSYWDDKSLHKKLVILKRNLKQY